MKLSRDLLLPLLVLALLGVGCPGGDDDDSSDDDDTTTDDDDTTGDDDDTTGDDDDSTEETLYTQLGGETGVNAVLDEFLANVGADTEINWFFANSDLAALKGLLHDQICEAAGGGCVYGGQTMAAAHANMAITDAQFGALVGDLLAALDTLGVPYTAGTFDGGLPADSLITVLAGMQGDIVTDADGDQVYFNQLGGMAAVKAVVTEFLTVVGADARINGRFASTDLAALNALVVEQVCEATGGFCTYSGLSMSQAHAGMCIAQTEWDAFVEDFLTALDNLGVGYSSTFDGSEIADALIVVLAGMEGDIVEDPENDGCN